MSNTIRITSAGNYYANTFDEVTYNPNSGYNKNLLQYSQNFDQTNSILSGWFGANSSAPYNAYILTNATKSPAGDSTGQKLLSAPAAAGSTIQRVYQNVNFVAGQAYTFSLYAKIAEFSNFISYVEPASGRVGITVNLSTLSVYVYAGATTNTFITPVGNGWYRVGFTWIAPATESATVDAMRLVNNSGQATFTGDGISGIYIWGAQLELGSTATIYQATGNGLTPANNSVSKIDSNGNSYITGQFDEVTGTYNPVGLVAYWDMSKVYQGANNLTDISNNNNTLTFYNGLSNNNRKYQFYNIWYKFNIRFSQCISISFCRKCYI